MIERAKLESAGVIIAPFVNLLISSGAGTITRDNRAVDQTPHRSLAPNRHASSSADGIDDVMVHKSVANAGFLASAQAEHVLTRIHRRGEAYGEI